MVQHVSVRGKGGVGVFIVALAVAATVPAAAGMRGARRPFVLGYPYARECPEAGYEDRSDRWHMNTCNCTSYAAWALAANGQRVDWFRLGEMDAHNWPTVARMSGVPVGRSPRVGAVAVWPRLSPPFGHLGYVTAVRADGTFDVAEYNLRRRFAFDARSHVASSGVTFIYVPRR
jgi:surface antigen